MAEEGLGEDLFPQIHSRRREKAKGEEDRTNFPTKVLKGFPLSAPKEKKAFFTFEKETFLGGKRCTFFKKAKESPVLMVRREYFSSFRARKRKFA